MILRVRPGTNKAKRQAIVQSGIESSAEGRPTIDRKMGTSDGGQGGALLRPANEDEMGQLQ